MEDQMAEDPLNITIRGFSTQTLQFEFDTANKKKEINEAIDKTEVVFNGNIYYGTWTSLFIEDELHLNIFINDQIL